MERTVPTRASDEIDLYLRTIYSLLRSTTRVHIRTLEEVHAGMNSSLHPSARSERPDLSSFIYAVLRLPACIIDVKVVMMGQSATVFMQAGQDNVENWTEVAARARRRRCFYNGKDLLACYIASRSDIDDVIPLMTAFQIEWNKLHTLLQDFSEAQIEATDQKMAEDMQELADTLQLSLDGLLRLDTIWGDQFKTMLKRIKAEKMDLAIQLFSGSLNEYRRATRFWWDNIEHRYPEIANHPVYFVSSNTHSIPNLMTGFALSYQDVWRIT